MRFRVLILSLIVLSITACETTRGTRERVWPYPESPMPGQPAGHPQSIPGQPSAIPPQGPQAVSPPEVKPLPAYPKAAQEISGGAVLSLLKQAREARDAGKPDQAQSALERALRIEPRNYFVWSALAGSYLDQKNYEQAITVAQKSNSLARGNVYVELENYRVIAAARDASGDAAGALQAQARADEIEMMLRQAQPPSSN